MARLANCPECDQEMFVPDGADTGGWGRCPKCDAFFKLQDMPSRELTAMEVVETATTDDAAKREGSSTVDDLSAPTLWSGDPLDEADVAEATEPEVADAYSPPKPITGNIETPDEIDFDTLTAMLDEVDVADEATNTAETIAFPPSIESEEVSTASEFNFDDVEIAELADIDDVSNTYAIDAEVADVEEDDYLELSSESTEPTNFDAPEADAPEVESPEAAAERIDAWFRSAKTLADMPAVESIEVNYKPAPVEEPTNPRAIHATVELGSGGIDELSDDFDLDAADDSAEDVAAWDDTKHMDRLLSDFQAEPGDELSFSDASGNTDEEAEGNGFPMSEPSPLAASFAVAPKSDRSRRQRSPVRMLLMTVLGGLMAVPLAGYTLMWLRGPEADFLGVAKYLPQAMLPASFRPAPKQTATTPPPMGATETENTLAEPQASEAVATEPPANEPAATEPAPPATETAKTNEVPPTPEPVATAPAEPIKPADAPAEQQATFNQPVAPIKPAPPEGDRYGIAGAANTKPTEPAAFDAPPATTIQELTPSSEPIRISGAPTFTSAELSAALQAGKDAEHGLLNGSLGESRETDRAKGFSYSILADLAQKATFAEASATNDVAKLQQESNDVFRKVLATPQSRGEIAQIVPKWIASPNRRQGGVFFAGSITGREAKGSVNELNIELGAGQTLPVLVPSDIAGQLKESVAPVGIVGWIVDKPADHVPGYTGAAPQAIFVTKLVPLE